MEEDLDNCDCCDHSHTPSNPFENLDEETQSQIQELQILEQNFQQLLMQKNAFSIERNEVDLIIEEVSKTDGDLMKIVGGQVVIKTTKDKIIDEMVHKKELISTRLKNIDSQETEFSEKIENLRDEIMKKIQG